MGLVIRGEMGEDLQAIREVVRAAFGRRNEADLVDALRRAGALAVSLVAEDEGRVVGHIALSPLTIVKEGNGKGVPGLALAPVAVRPDCQNEGIGTLLVEWGLTACRERGHRLVVVAGHPGFYPRFGFEPAHRFDIHPPFEAPGDTFMVLELEPGALEGVSGTVRYRPEFEGVGEG